MTVLEYKNLYNQWKMDLSAEYEHARTQQALGYRLPRVDRSLVIDTILLDAFLVANESLLDSDPVRIPEWCTESDFNEFISKLQYDAASKFS